jgi:hypothetical protein
MKQSSRLVKVLVGIVSIIMIATITLCAFNTLAIVDISDTLMLLRIAGISTYIWMILLVLVWPSWWYVLIGVALGAIQSKLLLFPLEDKGGDINTATLHLFFVLCIIVYIRIMWQYKHITSTPTPSQQ